ncbi:MULTISPECIES: alkaline phosphatase [Aeromonas]|uniref:alkaline phosphatase n=1 Tax=Aeromonas TaxID=642 RepID=UPI0011176B61|nr:alkaline phosphatase [Aeromonas veronii]MCR3957612.1 alkaline phosphatase [Aeromonas veronii]NJI24753.1 sulfatase-like hydrolase/transferase [Aeromonas veronii]NJI25656.1 sulfatase-like hydrolase/transferase [Aeromonas veronii]NJI35287.1 sulfatase-like hydrolase/transferase [Aeromonas veronii]TNJ14618.1 alkaline phosphatase [Aeromonas veronii]
MSKQMNTSIKHTLVCAALFSALGATSQAQAGDAKNVILFIGDGMGPTVLTATRLFKVGEEGNLEMMKLPRSARIKTFSNDAQTTDSAPSMAAYTTGVKMNNEVIAMSSDTKAVAPGKDVNGNKTVNNCSSDNGKPVPTILELAKAAGKSVGAVTTTELTHATPAATYAHICHRDAAYDIAAQAVPGGAGFNQALGDGVDVLMGGGANHWTPYSASNKGGRNDNRDLTAEMKAQGYSYVTTQSELAKVTSGKVLGLFSSKSHLDYELDRVAKGAANTQPSLSEMTAKAIDLLSKNSQGYFLMVEGGRIDHALHGTNAKRSLTDAVALDEAVKTALGKVDLSNTLIVVTADHDHTMTINGYSAKGNPVLDLVKNGDGSTQNDVDGKPFTTLVFGNGPNRPDVRPVLTSDQVMANDYLQETGVKLTSETHGGGDVMLFADGAGSNRFKGTLDNTKVFGKLREALGL